MVILDRAALVLVVAVAGCVGAPETEVGAGALISDSAVPPSRGEPSDHFTRWSGWLQEVTQLDAIPGGDPLPLVTHVLGSEDVQWTLHRAFVQGQPVFAGSGLVQASASENHGAISSSHIVDEETCRLELGDNCHWSELVEVCTAGVEPPCGEVFNEGDYRRTGISHPRGGPFSSPGGIALHVALTAEHTVAEWRAGGYGWSCLPGSFYRHTETSCATGTRRTTTAAYTCSRVTTGPWQTTELRSGALDIVENDHCPPRSPETEVD